MTNAPSAVGTARSGLRRVLSSVFPMAVAVGVMIGLGIFRTPGEVASAFGNPWVYLSIWLLGGLFCLLNALVVCELMALTDRSGGAYALVSRGMGSFPAFMVGWVDWLAWNCSLALKCVVFAEFLSLIWPGLAPFNVHLSLALALLFALLQWLGVEAGARLQMAAAAGLVALVIVSTLALLFAFDPSAPLASELATQPTSAEPTLRMYGFAAAAVVFSYDGWASGSYFGGEVDGGGKSVARSTILALLCVIALYLIVNLALVLTLGINAMAGLEMPLRSALETSWGTAGATATVIAVLLVLLANLNVGFLAAPRALYALSADGLAVGGAATVGRSGNPLVAVALTTGVIALMLLFGGFRALLSLSALLAILVYLALVLSVGVLRQREPDIPRAVQAWGYPWSYRVCLLGWVALCLFIGYTTPESAWATLVFVLIAWPAYRLVRLFNRPPAPSPENC